MTFGQAFVPPRGRARAGGKLRVSGNVDTEANKAHADHVLQAVKGVKAVENAIQVVPLQPDV